MYLNMQFNDGDLITNPGKSKRITVMGPRNMALQSTEIEFPSDLKYPYTFSALIANMKSGEEGYGNFQLEVFSKDMNMEASRLN